MFVSISVAVFSALLSECLITIKSIFAMRDLNKTRWVLTYALMYLVRFLVMLGAIYCTFKDSLIVFIISLFFGTVIGCYLADKIYKWLLVKPLRKQLAEQSQKQNPLDTLDNINGDDFDKIIHGGDNK